MVGELRITEISQEMRNIVVINVDIFFPTYFSHITIYSLNLTRIRVISLFLGGGIKHPSKKLFLVLFPDRRGKGNSVQANQSRFHIRLYFLEEKKKKS